LCFPGVAFRFDFAASGALLFGAVLGVATGKTGRRFSTQQAAGVVCSCARHSIQGGGGAQQAGSSDELSCWQRCCFKLVASINLIYLCVAIVLLSLCAGQQLVCVCFFCAGAW